MSAVGHEHELCEMVESIEVPFCTCTRAGPKKPCVRNHVRPGFPHGKGHIGVGIILGRVRACPWSIFNLIRKGQQ